MKAVKILNIINKYEYLPDCTSKRDKQNFSITTFKQKREDLLVAAGFKKKLYFMIIQLAVY